MTWPRPTPHDLAALYAGDYYDAHGMTADAAGAWVERMAEILRFSAVPAERVLDFGAGRGHSVLALRRLGIAATGVEPSAAARAHAQREHRIELLEGLPEGGSFDLVTLVHSLEHVPDPIDVLVDLTRRLRSGGAIYIEVPHAGSVELWRPSRRRHILTLPAHLFHFTPKTLEAVVRRAGLEVVRLRVADADWVQMLAALWQRVHRPSPEVTRPSRVEEVMARVAAPVAAAAVSRSTPKQRILAALPRVLPGWKFQLVARPAP